jgi:hypothetical protein
LIGIGKSSKCILVKSKNVLDQDVMVLIRTLMRSILRPAGFINIFINFLLSFQSFYSRSSFFQMTNFGEINFFKIIQTFSTRRLTLDESTHRSPSW